MKPEQQQQTPPYLKHRPSITSLLCLLITFGHSLCKTLPSLHCDIIYFLSACVHYHLLVIFHHSRCHHLIPMTNELSADSFF